MTTPARTLRIVVSTEHDPPLLLGTLMPSHEDDDGNIVRYFDSGANEEEHFAPFDCVEVLLLTLPTEVGY